MKCGYHQFNRIRTIVEEGVTPIMFIKSYLYCTNYVSDIDFNYNKQPNLPMYYNNNTIIEWFYLDFDF